MGRASAVYILLLVSGLSAQPPLADLDWFEKNVRPLLAENCFSCHGPKRQRAGLRVDHISTILAGGANALLDTPRKSFNRTRSWRGT